MNRAELEKRLMEDETFRKAIEGLKRVRENMEQAEMQAADARLRFYEVIGRLIIREGVPPAFVARQVGLSPQRINGIVQEIRQSLQRVQDEGTIGQTQRVETWEPIERPVPRVEAPIEEESRP